MDVQAIPPWLGTAIAGAALAVVGHVWNQFLQSREAKQKSQRERRARLVELSASIRAGDAAWAIQCENRDRLKQLIEMRMPELSTIERGYDNLFSLAYPTMTTEERELHDVVRAITIHTIRPINRAIAKWLKADSEFRIRTVDQTTRGKLAEYLQTLEVHLILWEAKYQTWIPIHPERALVYLADESQHGVEFPSDGVKLVHAVLSEKNAIDA